MVQIKALVTLMLVGTSLAAPLTRRQLAGEGAAADSLLTDTDNGVGYGKWDSWPPHGGPPNASSY